MDRELMCAICLEFFDVPLMLPCSHNFCKKCLQGIIGSREQYSYRSRSFDCPLCQRKTILERAGTESFPVNLVLENVIHLYKTEADISFNDASWTKDVDDSAGPCRLHKEPLDFYCLSCNQAVCKACNCNQKDTGVSHRICPIKEQMHKCQTNILKCLSEVKKKCVALTDRIQLLGDIAAGVDDNEKHISAILDEEVESLIAQLRSRKEELKRQLHNDMLDIKLPIEDQQRKHRALSSNVLDHQRKLSLVKGTKDPSLRIKLLQESERQLNSLLCFDLAWFSAHQMPTVNMPAWSLNKSHIEQAISSLSWQKTGEVKNSLGWSRGSSPSTESITIPTSTLTKLDIKDDRSAVYKQHVMEKKPQSEAFPLFLLKSNDEASKASNGVQAEVRSNIRGASEPPTTHRSSVSIQRRQVQGQNPSISSQNRYVGFGNFGQGQNQIVNTPAENGTQNPSNRTAPMYYVATASSGSSVHAHPNFNIKLPQKSDFEQHSNNPVTSMSNVPRYSLPGTANGMTIQLRRNSEGGMQSLHNTETSNPSVTSPTLPITTPITTSLLANLPSTGNIPTSSVSNTNETGATSALQPMDSVPVEDQATTVSSFSQFADNATHSQSNDSNFSNAQLPRITARDFSPNRAIPGRKTSRPKRVLKK